QVAAGHERVRLIVADEGAPLRPGSVAGARGLRRHLVRTLGQYDAGGEVTAVDADEPEGIEIARNVRVVAELLGQPEPLFKRADGPIVVPHLVTGQRAIPETAKERDGHPMLTGEPDAFLTQRQALSILSHPAPFQRQEVQGERL